MILLIDFVQWLGRQFTKMAHWFQRVNEYALAQVEQYEVKQNEQNNHEYHRRQRKEKSRSIFNNTK